MVDGLNSKEIATWYGYCNMVWVECVPCSPKDMFNLPPNLPLYVLHWRGRKMPGADRAFDSAEQAAPLIHFHRNASGLVTDDN